MAEIRRHLHTSVTPDLVAAAARNTFGRILEQPDMATRGGVDYLYGFFYGDIVGQLAVTDRGDNGCDVSVVLTPSMFQKGKAVAGLDAFESALRE